MASAYTRPDSPFWWIAYVGESHYERTPTKIRVGRNKTEQKDAEFRALKLARELEEKAERVRLGLAEPDLKPLLFEELAEKYLAIRASRKRSAGSIASRVRGHIIPHFRGRMSNTITPADVDEFLGLRALGSPCRSCAEGGCNGKR